MDNRELREVVLNLLVVVVLLIVLAGTFLGLLINQALASEATQLAATAHITVEQAEKDLAVQATGGSVVTDLRTALGDCYAGVWFNNKTAKWTVPIPEGCSKDTAKQVAMGGLPAAYPLAKHRYSALEATEAALNAELASYVQTAKAGVHIDPQAQKVKVVYAKTLTAAQKASVKLTAEQAGTTATVSADAAGILPMQAASCTFPYCSPLMSGVKDDVFVDQPAYGLYHQPVAWCSTGFVVKQAGAKYMLTAGHCLNEWVSGTNWTNSVWESGGCQFAKGNQEADLGPHWDAGIIPINEACSPAQEVQTWDETNSIIGYGRVACPAWGCANPTPPPAVVAYVGQWVCRSGARTRYQCGMVRYTDAFGGIVGGGYFEHIDGIAMYANLGDSGGPLYARSEDRAAATGVLSLTNAKPCVETGPTCFSGETEAVMSAQALGVNF